MRSIRSGLIVIILLAGLMIGSLSAQTLIIKVDNVYWNDGDITVDYIPEGGGGEFSNDFEPTVYCCGVQTIVDDELPEVFTAESKSPRMGEPPVFLDTGSIQT